MKKLLFIIISFLFLPACSGPDIDFYLNENIDVKYTELLGQYFWKKPKKKRLNQEDMYNTYIAKLKEVMFKLPQQYSISKEDFPKYFISGYRACNTNNYSSVVELIEAMSEDPAAKDGFYEIVKIRHKIISICTYEGVNNYQSIMDDISSIGQAPGVGLYPLYLEAILYFYDKKYTEAIEVFSQISSRSTNWLGKTASYMIGRSYLIWAQMNWDGTEEEIHTVNQEKLEEAKDAFKAHEKKYGNDLYQHTISNIKRKIMHLMGEQDELDLAQRHFFNLSLEDNEQSLYQDYYEFKKHYKGKLNFEGAHPFLIAAYIMKPKDSFDDMLDELKEVKSTFKNSSKNYSELYDFLEKYLLFKDKNFENATKDYIQKTFQANNYAGIAEAIVIAKAYEEQKKYKESLDLWKKVIEYYPSDIIQTHMAKNMMKLGEYKQLGDTYSPIKNQAITQYIFQYLLDEEQLKEIAMDKNTNKFAKDTAISLIMNQYLVSKEYNKFNNFYQLLTNKRSYPSIIDVVKSLSIDPDNYKDKVRLAFFMIDNAVIPKEVEKPPKFLEKIGKIAFNTGVGAIEEYETPLKMLIAGVNHYKEIKRRNDDEAHALNQLIKCFKNFPEARVECSWEKNLEKYNQGQEWFGRLKTKYKYNKYAKDLKYWY